MIQATEFKAKCLALLDDIAAGGDSITILKRGNPVAQLVAPTPRDQGYPQLSLLGSVELTGDLIEPVLPATAWDAERGEEG